MSEPKEYVFKKLDWCLNYSNQKFLPGQTVPRNMPLEVVAAWLENGTIAPKEQPAKVAPVKVEPEPQAEPEMIPVRLVTPKGEPAPDVDYSSMTSKELDPILIANGLPIRGSKADKLERLSGLTPGEE